MLLEEVSLLTGLSAARLRDFARSADRRYKVYDIPKRNGGTRTIEQPSRPIKALQRIVSEGLFLKLPVHPSCLGYRKKLGIADVANAHKNFPFTLRVDFKDFFWSFKIDDIKNYLTSINMNLSDDDILFVSQLVSRNGRLTMGAPSSPAITNVMLFDLDKKLADISSDYNCAYTRYADDLYFSSAHPFVLQAILPNIQEIVDTWNRPFLKINEEKTAFLSRRYRKMVVGLTLTPEGKVSIGRDRKRRILSQTHKALLGQLDPICIASLAGEIAWIQSVEPTFIESLIKKYGQASLSILFPAIHAPPIASAL